MSAKKLYAIAHFCNDYHSGQSSRGYRLFCLAQRLLRRKGLSFNADYPNKSWILKSTIYQILVDNHSEKI